MGIVNADMAGNENAFFKTGRVVGNEIVKAEDFNESFESIVDNFAKFSKMVFETKKDFVIGGKVEPATGLNIKINPLFGVSQTNGKPFGFAQELNGFTVGIPGGSTNCYYSIAIRGLSVTYDNQQRAFNDLDTETVTYQKVDTKTGFVIQVNIIEGAEGQAPDVDISDGWVKLCEINRKAGATSIEEDDIFNITADVSELDNENWTNQQDATYNIGYISDVNARFREQHNVDGTHKENIITTTELDIGTGAKQVNGTQLPVAKQISVNGVQQESDKSIADLIAVIASKVTAIFNDYLKYGKFNFNGELVLSDFLTDDKSQLSNMLKIGSTKDENDNYFAYIKYNDNIIFKISETGTVTLMEGYEAKGSNDLIIKSVTDALSLAISGLDDRVSEIEKNLDPTAASNRVLSKFTVFTDKTIKVASTGNIASLSGPTIIDGVECTPGDYVLIKNQTNQKENGVYQIADSTWNRYTGEITKVLFNIKEGTVNGGSIYFSVTDLVQYGTTDIEFLKAIYSIAKKPYTVALRDENGNVKGSSPNKADDLTPKSYVNNVANVLSGGGLATYNTTDDVWELLLDNFTLSVGSVIRVLFTTSQTKEDPKIKINNGTAIAIKAVKAGLKIAPPVHSGKWRGATEYSNEVWQPYTTLEMMYDGTDWVIMGNPELENWSNDTEGYTVLANGYIVQRSVSAAAQYTANFYVKFTTTKYAVTPADGDCSNYGSWFGYAWGLSTSAKTVSSVYIGKYAAANNYGGWYGIPVIMIFSGY